MLITCKSIIMVLRFFTLTFATLFFVRCGTAADNQSRPNIVFMYADDWRWDCLGIEQKERGDNGRFPWLETPRLDKLASEGVRFRNSFVVNSLCSPGRACVLTSRYSHLNGIIGNSTPMSADTPTLGTQLKEAGYSTAYCGKFHMDSQRERPGFDYVASLSDRASTMTARSSSMASRLRRTAGSMMSRLITRSNSSNSKRRKIRSF